MSIDTDITEQEIMKQAEERKKLARELEIGKKGSLITEVLGSYAESRGHSGRKFIRGIGEVFKLEESKLRAYDRKIEIFSYSGGFSIDERYVTIHLEDIKKRLFGGKESILVYNQKQYRGFKGENIEDPVVFKKEDEWLNHLESFYSEALSEQKKSEAYQLTEKTKRLKQNFDL